MKPTPFCLLIFSRIGTIVILWAIAACQPQPQPQRRTLTEQSPILRVKYDLPDKNYTLGDVRFPDLLEKLVLKQSDSQQQAIFCRLRQCQNEFESDNLPFAMYQSAGILSEIWGEENDAIDSLLSAEALYILTRTYFYDRNTSLEPTNSLLLRAMDLSAGLVHTSDTLTQIVSLFQLAREHDVWEGVTTRYGRYVSSLLEEEWMHASSVALNIKEEYLGLEGPAIMRSLCNQYSDYQKLRDNGIPFQEEEMIDCLRKGLTIIERLESKEVNEYGEYIGYFFCSLWNHQQWREHEDSIRKVLTQWLRFLTENDTYELGNPVTHIINHRAMIGWANMLPKYLLHFKQTFDKSDLEETRETLTKLLEQKARKRYKKGKSESLTGLIKYLRMRLAGEHRFPITGKAAFGVFQMMIPHFFIQERSALIDRYIADEDSMFRQKFDEIYIIRDSLKGVERKLQQLPTQEAFALCSKWNQAFLNTRSFLNQKRAPETFTLQTLPLAEIQQSLQPNETWISLMKDGMFSFIAICDKETFSLDSLPGGSTYIDTSPRMQRVYNRLKQKISYSHTWTAQDQTDLEALAQFYFKGRIPPATQHLILSSSHIDDTSISTNPTNNLWDLLLYTYMKQQGRLLKSIRYSGDIFYKERRLPVQTRKNASLIAIAPKFERKRFDKPPSGLDFHPGFMSMDDADNPRAGFGHLDYNIPEVLRIGERIETILLVGEEASEASFLQQNSSGSVLHFSTHAFVNKEEPFQSGIVMGSNYDLEGIGENDNILRAHEIRRLPLDAELVVLSACQTGTGPKREMGVQWTLAHAFREAGCQNIISSAWKVNDKATHDILIEFYAQLLDGKGKAEALYLAKEKYRNENPSQGPFYWAPLRLHGDNLEIALCPN